MSMPAQVDSAWIPQSKDVRPQENQALFMQSSDLPRLFVRNTFIDCDADQSLHIGLLENRRARSCPGSPVSHVDVEPGLDRSLLSFPNYVAPWRHLSSSKTVACDLFRSENCTLLRFGKVTPSKGMDDADVTSDCSTVDTQDRGMPMDDLATQTRAQSAWLGTNGKSMNGGVNQVTESPDVPNVGSLGHDSGNCKPCAFFAKKGCNLENCDFCHLCGSGEKKRRQKDKRAFFNKMRLQSQLSTKGCGTH